MKCPKNKQCPKSNNSTEEFYRRMKDYKKPLCNKCNNGKDKGVKKDVGLCSLMRVRMKSGRN